MKKSLVAMFAHPDDESFGPAGTLALLSKEYNVHLICATRGEGGENHHPDAGKRDLKEIRTEELLRSSEVLGIKKVHFLDFPDGGLCNSCFGEVLKKSEDIIHRIKPEQILTFEPEGLTGHMDHIFVTKVATSIYDRNDYIKQIMYYCFDTKSQETIQQYYQRKGFDVCFPKGLEASKADLAFNIKPVLNQKYESMFSHVSQQADREAYVQALEATNFHEYFLVQN